MQQFALAATRRRRRLCGLVDGRARRRHAQHEQERAPRRRRATATAAGQRRRARGGAHSGRHSAQPGDPLEYRQRAVLYLNNGSHATLIAMGSGNVGCSVAATKPISLLQRPMMRAAPPAPCSLLPSPSIVYGGPQDLVGGVYGVDTARQHTSPYLQSRQPNFSHTTHQRTLPTQSAAPAAQRGASQLDAFQRMAAAAS